LTFGGVPFEKFHLNPVNEKLLGVNLMFRKRFWWIFVLVTVIVAGCSAEEPPGLIASYPAERQIATYPITPPGSVVVYHATVELDVSDVDRSGENLNVLALQYGGYLSSSQSWYQDGKKHTTLVLTVPVIHFEAVHRAVLEEGDLVGEWVSGELRPLDYGDGAQQTFSHITVHLRPAASVFPSVELPNWRPARTFARAWGVFAAIFGFLLDVVIWVGVVAGPFMALGLFARALIRRRRGKKG